jgi:AraC family transcriptional regulator, exoenzyme S synthesis regulatory protein ExsA
MKNIFTIPNDLFPRDICPVPIDKTAIRFHYSSLPAVKNRIAINKNLFSFLLEGEKVLHRLDNRAEAKVTTEKGQGTTPRRWSPLKIRAGQFLMLAEGNSLMTEQLSAGGQYISMLFFFDNSVLNNFFLKYPGLSENAGHSYGRGEEPVVCFEGDAFIRSYVDSLQRMLEATPFLQEELQLLKLEELLLYLAANYPAALYSFRPSQQPDAGEWQVRAAVEGNLDHTITVEELAFLCNMSISTFKRKFARTYGMPPNKWLLQKRMELAADLLLHQQEKPSEVYHKVGYENHSSFTQSFKQIYGVTPKEFQQGAAEASRPQ